MKKIGKGKDYQRALVRNLTQSLFAHAKIVTSKKKAALVQSAIVKKYGGTVKTYRVGRKRGDGSQQILVVWNKPINYGNKVDKN